MDPTPDAAPACPLPAARARTPGRRAMTVGELVLIAVAVGGIWLATPGQAWELPLGTALAYASALVLGQGLVRDLVRLAVRRSPGQPRQRLVCLCAESSLGLVMLAAGLTLLLAGVEEPVVLGRGALTGAVAGLLAAGFVAKDYVLTIRRVEDHGSISLW